VAEPVFKIRDLCFSYGELPVLRDFNLTLEGGHFHGVLGPNGSGKSTLLDLMTANLKAAAGQVFFQGREVVEIPPAGLAARLALAPQDYSMHFPFTVREIVSMGRHPHIPRFASPQAEDLAAVDRAMREMAITHLADQQVTELSGGEKQRVALARTLAQDTEVILLDEPTASLDVNHSLSVLRGLERRVNQEGRTVVAVMHDIGLAAAFCDRLVLIKQGRAHAAGPTDQVLNQQSIWEVYGVRARVAWDDYAGCRVVTLQKPEGEK